MNVYVTGAAQILRVIPTVLITNLHSFSAPGLNHWKGRDMLPIKFWALHDTSGFSRYLLRTSALDRTLESSNYKHVHFIAEKKM